MRVLVLTDNFVPEQNAPALRTFEHCRRWIEEGVSVTVVTPAPTFPTGKVQKPYRNWVYKREVLEGIDVVRVWSFLAPNDGVLLRALDFASFAFTGALASLLEKPDVVMATSPQLLTGFAGHFVAWAKRCPWVFEVRDLWPDSITAVEAMKDGAITRMLARMERRLYRSADRIVTVTEPLRVRIADSGVPKDKVGVVPNGANLKRLTPRGKCAVLMEQLKLEGQFVVGYVGTHGMAQGLEVVLRAAQNLRGSDVHFLFVGEGARRKALMSMAKALNLANVTFTGAVPSHVAVDYLAVCDAVVIPLKKSALFEGALPSKIFEAAAMERPIVLSANGIAAETVREFGAGLVAEPGDFLALANAVRTLKANPALHEQCREGCRRLARAHDRDRLAKLMLSEIRSAVGSRSPVKPAAQAAVG